MTSLSRRTFMLGSASLLGLASMRAGLATGSTAMDSMVLISGRLAAELGLTFMPTAIHPLVILDSDPVAQSRGPLAEFLSAGIPASCITDWSDYVVMRGIARDYFYRRFSSPEAIQLSDLANSVGQSDRPLWPVSAGLNQEQHYFRWSFS